MDKDRDATPRHDANHELLDALGIVSEFTDTSGTHRVTSKATCESLLRAMHVDPARPQLPAPPSVRVVRRSEVHGVAHAGELSLEEGGRLDVKGSLPPDVPLGYHDLVHVDGNRTRLIVVPSNCPLPAKQKSWAWAAQLYALRSEDSWGVGDLADLRRLASWSRDLGASAIFLNPLAATTPVAPEEPSPYSPSSRCFLNPLYISIADVPGAGTAEIDLDQFATVGRALLCDRMIDRDRVSELKMGALQSLWPYSANDPRCASYCEERGESLVAFARYCALAENFGGDWRDWGEEYRHPQSAAVARFAEQNQPRVQLYQWLQWILDLQLSQAAKELPIAQDLPIGFEPGGADAWTWQDELATGVTVGAPPDQFNPQGQDWGSPPFVPHRLQAADYEPFIQTVRATLRHSSGMRIDHVMGLFRLFWIPEGLGPQNGAYVRYPADDLLGIVALESHRAGAWIAGEDLGTVEHEVRTRLADQRLLAYRVFWFEEDLPPEYPEYSVAMMTTHDLPTVAGAWTKADSQAQRRLGIPSDEAAWNKIRERMSAVLGLSAETSIEEVIEKAYQLLGQASSSIVVATLEDAIAVEERPNMPGTIDEWPNWRLALPMLLEELQSAPLPQAIAKALSSRA